MHRFAVVRVHVVRIRCRRIAVILLRKKTGALYAINTPVRSIRQSIGLRLQSMNELVEDLGLTQPRIRIAKAVNTDTYLKTDPCCLR
jgi:hypothetical protein